MKSKRKKPSKELEQPSSVRTQTQKNYPDLHRMASKLFVRERRDHTLQPTGLLHEAFLRFQEPDVVQFPTRRLFFGAMKRQMKRVLIDYARKRGAMKHGGRLEKVPLEDAQIASELQSTATQFTPVLEKLRTIDAGLFRVIQLRVFAGMTHREIANVLHKGESTVRRDFSEAKKWLRAQMKEGSM